MLRTESVQINAAPKAAGTPIIRRDTNTLVLDLTQAEALGLIAELTTNFDRGTFDSITVVIEFDKFYSKDMD